MSSVTVSTPYVLSAGQTLSFVDEPAFLVSRPFGQTADPSLTISGSVSVMQDPGSPGASIGISVDAGGPYDLPVVITSTGVVDVSTQDSHNASFGFLGGYGGNDPDFDNDGILTVSATYAAQGASDNGASHWHVSNEGALIVTSFNDYATGLEGTGPLDTYTNSGTLTVTGHLSAIGVLAPSTGAGASFFNSGTIQAHADSAAVSSVGVAWHSLFMGDSSFVNNGVMQGDYALQSDAYAINGGVDLYTNNGSVIGVVDLGASSTTLVNNGTITGAINLGDGNDVYDGRLGKETGLLSGGAGNDTETGGAGFDNLQGNQGNDSLSGGGGDDIVVGGKDDDIQAGGDGDDVVWGNLGNDTLDGGNGADQVRGGQGDDSISGGAGNDFISGDRGNDTESGGAGADLFHGSQDAGIDKVLDFNQAEGDRVELDPGTTYTLSQVGADTVIDMGPSSGGAPNQMILVGVQLSTLKDGWIFEG